MPDSRSDCARSWERSLARTWYVWRTCCGRVADRRPVPTRAHALSELSRVSPELFNVFPGVPKPVEWSAEVIPLRLAGAFLKAVEAATDESPLVLVVDDIHAADNASAAILHMVARKLSRTRLLLILTGR